MELNAALRELYKGWAEVTENELAKSMWKKDVMHTHSLYASLDHKLLQDGIHIMYNYYGMFPDMGVGKGVGLGDVRDTDNGRRPKKWYSKTFYREVARLGELVAEMMGDEAVHTAISERNQIFGQGTQQLYDEIKFVA